MDRAATNRRIAIAFAAVLALAACKDAETSDIAATPLETAGLAVAATSEGDVEAVEEAAAGSVATLSDANVFGLLGMVDNSEIEAAKIARDRGTSNRVKEFARMMEAEHTQLLQAGREIAREMALEAEPPPARQLEQMHIESMEMLAREPRGDQFDRAYIAGQVTAHDRVLELMRAAASREDRDTRLTRHLQSAIAVVEQHRDRARGVLEALGDAEDVSDR